MKKLQELLEVNLMSYTIHCIMLIV